MGKEKNVESAADESANLKASWFEIRKKHHILMAWMVALFLLCIIFLIVTLLRVHPSTSTVISGYGDVYQEIAGLSRGYRWEAWWNMLAFPILALFLGVLHNLLAIKIYQKYGKDLATYFVAFSCGILLVALFAMLRVVGEW